MQRSGARTAAESLVANEPKTQITGKRPKLLDRLREALPYFPTLVRNSPSGRRVAISERSRNYWVTRPVLSLSKEREDNDGLHACPQSRSCRSAKPGGWSVLGKRSFMMVRIIHHNKSPKGRNKPEYQVISRLFDSAAIEYYMDQESLLGVLCGST